MQTCHIRVDQQALLLYIKNMSIEKFLGRRPSHFQMNPIVKAYILSEALLWSGWDFVIPLFSVFVVSNIIGGTIQTAAAGYSTYLITRVMVEITTGRLLQKSNDRKKLMVALFGMSFLSVAYLGFAFSTQVLTIFIFYAVLGMGLGIAAPAKNSLFAIHLDKNKEATEWSIMDAVCFICMALATALAGFIAASYGFTFLFILASVINLLAMVPYLVYLLSKQN